MPPLYNKIRGSLLDLACNGDRPIDLLDVGGRKSHYTIGIPAHITITDLPRDSEVQKALNLGVTPEIANHVLKIRSNVREVVFDDMTRSALPDSSFDAAVAVEVLEHVEQDDQFLNNVHRVLRPGGWFLMSTPNGDYVRNTNPDHKRHYTREQLRRLLDERFTDVRVEYAIKGGTFRKLGMVPWSIKRPAQSVKSMLGHLINAIESAPASLKTQAIGTHHLIAIARKQT
jgi:SAM-dependent methyltransferase